MDASQIEQVPTFQKLTATLDELVKLYRTLLDLVRKEKDLLIKADIENLNESNKTKEALLAKIRSTDMTRERIARELAAAVGADIKNPRLLEISKKMKGAESDRLRQLHGALVMLIERVSEINRDNETYTESALKALNVALGDVKNTLGGKKTYARKGQLQDGPNKSGNFVSKEA